jgi:hypothetical protein
VLLRGEVLHGRRTIRIVAADAVPAVVAVLLTSSSVSAAPDVVPDRDQSCDPQVLQGAAIAAGSGAVRPKNGWVCDRRGKSVMYGAAAQSRVTT